MKTKSLKTRLARLRPWQKALTFPLVIVGFLVILVPFLVYFIGAVMWDAVFNENEEALNSLLQAFV